DMKFLMIIDGKTSYYKEGDKRPQTTAADAKVMQGARLFVARLGVAGSLVIVRSSATDSKEGPNVDQVAQIKSVKLGAREKVGKLDAQVVELAIDWATVGAVKESIWIDTQTQLPLKRVF